MAVKTVSPAIEPVTLAEAKTWLHVDHSDDDALIEFLITAAREMVEDRTNLLVARRTMEATFDAFPCVELQLPGPVLSVESVTHVDEDGYEQTLAADEWVLDNPENRPGWLVPYEAWPFTLGTVNAVRIRYEAGYETPELTPSRIKLVIHLLLRGWYDVRSSIIVGKAPAAIPFGVDSALERLRVFS